MKKIPYLILFAVAAASCSSPKYTASFMNYNNQYAHSAYVEKKVEASSVTINPAELVASSSATPVLTTSVNTTETAMVKKTYLQMDRQQRKEVRAEIKSQIKAQMKARKSMGVQSAQATQGMDKDLKLAAIFGAVGIVALIISGDVFYVLGGIALIIGVVFFVKWLVRQ